MCDLNGGNGNGESDEAAEDVDDNDMSLDAALAKLDFATRQTDEIAAHVVLVEKRYAT